MLSETAEKMYNWTRDGRCSGYKS